MTDNIVKFPGVEDIMDLDDAIPTNEFFDAAIERNLTDVLVIGTKPDGEFYFASSTPDYMQILWDLERAKDLLMRATLGD